MDKTIGPTLQSQVHVGASAWLAKNDAFLIIKCYILICMSFSGLITGPIHGPLYRKSKKKKL
jgi:hypothetical protein